MRGMKTTCALGCLALLIGCGGDRWSLSFEKLPGALTSVWGSTARDVWAAGGDPGDGTGPFVLHFDGKKWTRLKTGQTAGDLWWVHGFANGAVYFGGKNGLILQWRDGVFQRLATPGTGTVFGLWGATPEDLWAVGGDGDQNGFAWRFDGATWRKVEPLPPALAAASLFKISGRSANDAWLVGSRGVTAHWDGSALTEVSSGTARTLFTDHAGAARTAAVGGFGSGVLLELEGGKWKDVTPPKTPQLIGVRLTQSGGYAVGVDGAVVHRTDTGWENEPTGLEVSSALHAVWVDPEGGVWAVGGQVLDYPLINGVLLHKGPPIPGGTYSVQ